MKERERIKVLSYQPDERMDWSHSGGGGKNCLLLVYIFKAELTECADGLYGRVGGNEVKNER